MLGLKVCTTTAGSNSLLPPYIWHMFFCLFHFSYWLSFCSVSCSCCSDILSFEQPFSLTFTLFLTTGTSLILHSVSCDYLNEIASEEYVTLSHQRCICECIYLNMGKIREECGPQQQHHLSFFILLCIWKLCSSLHLLLPGVRVVFKTV